MMLNEVGDIEARGNLDYALEEARLSFLHVNLDKGGPLLLIDIEALEGNRIVLGESRLVGDRARPYLGDAEVGRIRRDCPARGVRDIPKRAGKSRSLRSSRAADSRGEKGRSAR